MHTYHRWGFFSIERLSFHPWLLSLYSLNTSIILFWLRPQQLVVWLSTHPCHSCNSSGEASLTPVCSLKAFYGTTWGLFARLRQWKLWQWFAQIVGSMFSTKTSKFGASFFLPWVRRKAWLMSRCASHKWTRWSEQAPLDLDWRCVIRKWSMFLFRLHF